ncbi:hypothetical protein OUZ56_030674 [Daphnia magna]|uniref:Uncharacterized protein n=1 Tax=Daphnia magna TaxID=35525 RepID=A0ABQ9ZSW2_9CRUS|nr:hypothetical protein OUZ56_030674 [Daphnia magna]
MEEDDASMERASGRHENKRDTRVKMTRGGMPFEYPEVIWNSTGRDVDDDVSHIPCAPLPLYTYNKEPRSLSKLEC